MPEGQLYFREQPRRVYVETNRVPHPQFGSVGDEMVTLRVFEHEPRGFRGEAFLPPNTFNIWSRDLNLPHGRIKPVREE